jgi:hypothetical protein
MKRLLVLPALAAAVFFLASCANNSSAATAASGGNGGGSLAFTVDGTKTVVNPPTTTLYLNEVSHDAAKGTVKVRITIFPAGELLDFHVADKGTTPVVHYTPSFTEDKVSATYMSHTGHNFYGDQVSVSISAADATHVAGTFSGTFTNEGKTVTITDGSFDLPLKAKN